MTAPRRQTIEADGLGFDALAAGPADGALVLLLHGFPQSLDSWRHQVPALGKSGFHAVAVNQRGYSPGARPDGVENYATPLIIADALSIADSIGADRFHLVGHDWGGQIAWLLAAGHGERLQSLTVLSRPHPAAFARAWTQDPEQQERSKHHRAFQDPDSANLLLADNARRLRRNLQNQGVGGDALEAYVATLSDPGAMEAALNWYRATWQGGSALSAADVPAITVPTLYLWGDADATVGRFAAEATADFVTGPYEFVAVPGAGHFLTDDVPELVSEHLVNFIGRHDG